MTKLAWLCLALAPWLASAAELVKRCDLGSKPGHRVEIIRDFRLGPTFAYFLKANDRAQPVFGDLDNSRGSSVSVLCVGRRNHVLVLTGEFNANALQGFALSYNAEKGRTERLEFAEKRRPERLYMGQRELWVVIPSGGHGETDKKYVIYRIAADGVGDARIDAIDELPPSTGFESLLLWPERRRGR